jgi:hypothetical protein
MVSLETLFRALLNAPERGISLCESLQFPQPLVTVVLVDSEIVFKQLVSTRYGKVRVFINKTISTEITDQQDLINTDPSYQP